MPSSVRSLRLPSFHILSLLSRQVACSFAFDLRCGFWRSRIGSTMTARRGIDSIEEVEAKAKNI